MFSASFHEWKILSLLQEISKKIESNICEQINLSATTFFEILLNELIRKKTIDTEILMYIICNVYVDKY